MGAGRFGAGRTTAMAATHAQLSGARMMTGNLPVVPSRASLSASGWAAAPSTIHNGASQHFFGTHSASRPESFQQQTAHLQQTMQQNHVSAVTAGGRSNGTSRAMESRGASESRETSSAAAGGKIERRTRHPPAERRTILQVGARIDRRTRKVPQTEENRAAASGRRLHRPRAATVANRPVAAEMVPSLTTASRVEATGTAPRRVQATRADRLPAMGPATTAMVQLRVRN